MVATRAARSVHEKHPIKRRAVDGPAPPRAAAEPATRVAVIAGKGRGVLAGRAIRRGEVVERVPVLVVPSRDYAALSSTVLDSYVYDWGAGELAVALGNGSLYNHSFQPNLAYERRPEEQTIEYRALRDIAAGEELLINYNGRVDDHTPMRFDVR